MADDVQLDEAAIEDLLNGMDGPVYALMELLSGEIVTVARVKVPVRRADEIWKTTSDASVPGFTLASIRSNVNYAPSGKLFGGAAAAEDPTVFLEDPRVDRIREPFLTTGLDSLVI